MAGVDLHLHSSASDGECPPADVPSRARAAGLDLIALTDHDTLAGVGDASRAGDQVGVTVIAGCEFSVAAAWGEMHLLAYYLPLGHLELDEFLTEQREARAARIGSGGYGPGRAGRRRVWRGRKAARREGDGGAPVGAGRAGRVRSLPRDRASGLCLQALARARRSDRAGALRRRRYIGGASE